mmetsp:Transcript_29745/g.85355  ORF Transcript_29745/g.85355 Transcript_29745/m.85355 type:complete len:313 (+) Transcript_29745:647-1585(+)
MSLRKPWSSRCSSTRREIRVQSSYSNFAKSGSPLPMSATFLTLKTSMSSASISVGLSSPSSSLPFFVVPSFFHSWSCASTFFHSDCFFFQSVSSFCHSRDLSLNHLDGWMSSTRCVSFRVRTHSRRCSAHFSLACHPKRTSSKPSAASGMLNFVKDFARSEGSMSRRGLLRKQRFFSSSLSSTITSSATSSAISLSPSFSSSASVFATSPSALAFSRLASTSLFRSASAFFLFSSASSMSLRRCRLRVVRSARDLASALALFSRRSAAWARSLCSAGGSPISTTALFLKSGKRAAAARLASASRLPLTSTTT